MGKGGIKNYCGWVCQNKHDFVIYILLSIPFLIWLFMLINYLYVLDHFRIGLYSVMKSGVHKVDNFSKKLKLIENKTANQLDTRANTNDDEAEPIIKDMNMLYITNPLHLQKNSEMMQDEKKMHEMRELNRQSELLEDELREMSLAKIKLLKSNRHLFKKLGKMKDDNRFMEEFLLRKAETFTKSTTK